MNINEAKALKSNCHVVFDSPAGKEVMLFLEAIGHWTPTVYDSGETNEIIARDANRRLIGTIKSILTLTPQQISVLTEEE